MSLLSNVPCNLIARELIETWEQAGALRKGRRKRSDVGLRRKKRESVCRGQTISELMTFMRKTRGFFSLFLRTNATRRRRVLMCPAYLSISSISPPKQPRSIFWRNECGCCSNRISHEKLIIEASSFPSFGPAAGGASGALAAARRGAARRSAEPPGPGLVSFGAVTLGLRGFARIPWRLDL